MAAWDPQNNSASTSMGLSCTSETGIDWFAIADMPALSQIHTGRVDRV